MRNSYPYIYFDRKVYLIYRKEITNIQIARRHMLRGFLFEALFVIIPFFAEKESCRFVVCNLTDLMDF
jgi:hypothetical protein